MQFEFSIKFHDIAGKSLPLKEVPQVITAGDQGPHELMQADSLGRPACADCAKSTLDIFIGLLQQPFTQVAIDLGRCQFQFCGWNLSKVRGTFRQTNLFSQPPTNSSECFSIKRTSFSVSTALLLNH